MISSLKSQISNRDGISFFKTNPRSGQRQSNNFYIGNGARVSQSLPTTENHVCNVGECYVCLRNLFKEFDGVAAVTDVSFELAKGQLMALLGPSGCGKTSTLRLLAGFEKLDAGEIDIGGELVAGPSLHLPPEQRRVSMVFQEYALFPHLDVAENICFGLHAYDGDKTRRVWEVLELVGLTGREKRMPHELSGGQQQRVALARALAPKPDLVLLDEPFSNLDASLRVRVRAEVREILRQANATAIFVTHDQEEALSMVDQVAVMIDGTIHQVAPPYQLYQQPSSRQVAEFVGDANFLSGIAKGQEVECELGRLETQTSITGSVDVLIRPESISVRPTSADTSCYVRDILFFGHDQLITVQLPSGNLLNTRMGSMHHYAVGQPVQLNVNGPVMTYA